MWSRGGINLKRDKTKDPEETFLSTTSSTIYSTSTRLVLGWANAGRLKRLSCDVAMNRFNFSLLLAI